MLERRPTDRFTSLSEAIEAVMLVPGHTFFGFWRTHQAHRDFWTGLRSPTGVPTWTIEDGPKLNSLVDTGDVVLVEATDICRASSYLADRASGTERLDAAAGVSRSF